MELIPQILGIMKSTSRILTYRYTEIINPTKNNENHSRIIS